jgi:hydrogenase maturation protease
MKILILGLGNDLFGDDGLGIEAVRKLNGKISGCDFQETSAFGLSLINYFIGYERAIIIDSIAGDSPGRIHSYSFKLESTPQLNGRAPHAVGIHDILNLMTNLDLVAPREVAVYVVEITNTEIGSSLSEHVLNNFPILFDKIKTKIFEWQNLF